MRIVFFGTPAFAVPSLAALMTSEHDVVAVVTQPDRPKGRSHSTLVAPPVKNVAIAAGIPVLQPLQARGAEFNDSLRALNADIAVVVAYGHLLRPDLLAIPPLGFVNVHASLLPRWRGAAPIQWAILSGDPETGAAIMRIETGLDTGAVWHERDTAISDSDTAATLTERLAHLGAEALLEALPRIASGATPRPQDDVGVTHAPKINRDIARIRWEEPAHAISCRIRAMDPAPGAWTTVAGAEIKLFGATVGAVVGAQHAAPGQFGATAGGVGAQHAAPGHGRAPQRAPHTPHTIPHAPEPGTISVVAGTMHVQTSDGAVTIAEVQPAGKRRMPATEWLRGANLPAGARLD